MARLSNPQGILFIEQCVVLSMHDTHSGWMTRAESGQARFNILDLVVKGRGVVIETRDDIIQCAFASAQAAVDAAIAIQAAFAPPARSSKRQGTTVRQAVVYGQLSVTNARSEGEILIQGMRILEEADDGEILIAPEALSALSNPEHIQALRHQENRSDLAIHALDEWALLKDDPAPAPPISVDAQEIPMDDNEVAHFDLADHADDAYPDQEVVDAETLLDEPEGEVAVFDLDGDPAENAESPQTTGPSLERVNLVISLKCPEKDWSFGRDQAPVVIGRGSDCHVRVKNPHVSRRHAQIRWTETELLLINLSGNGTMVRFDDDPDGTAHPAPVDLKQSGEIALNSSFESDKAEIIRFEIQPG